MQATATNAPREVAKAFIEAWAAGDMDTVAGYLADDAQFRGPLASAEGADEVLRTIGPFAELVTDVTVIAAVGDDERAMVMYDMTTAPFGVLRAVDCVVVSDGKIKSDTLVFDTHEVRKAEHSG